MDFFPNSSIVEPQSGESMGLKKMCYFYKTLPGIVSRFGILLPSAVVEYDKSVVLTKIVEKFIVFNRDIYS